MFQWKGATISANDDLTISDENRISALANKLGEEIEFIQRYRWAEFMIAAEVTGDEPLPMVTEYDEPEAVQASFEAWGKMKRRFGTLWAIELNAAETDEKKDTPSQS